MDRYTSARLRASGFSFYRAQPQFLRVQKIAWRPFLSLGPSSAHCSWGERIHGLRKAAICALETALEGSAHSLVREFQGWGLRGQGWPRSDEWFMSGTSCISSRYQWLQQGVNEATAKTGCSRALHGSPSPKVLIPQMNSEGLWKKIAAVFVGALVVYIFGYSAIEHRRTRHGPR